MTKIELSRRGFLSASGAAAFLTFAGGAVTLETSGAEARSNPELDKLLSEMESQGSKMLSVPKQDGKFLSLLVRLGQCKNVLEVGTSQGYSAIWISRALQETGGKLTTIDIDLAKVALAKANLAKSGLAEPVTVMEGDAHKIVPTLKGKFDFVFLDADKEGQLDYFKKLYPDKLLPGGVIAVHNAIRAAGAMKDYLDMIQAHEDFDSVVLSLTMQDGFSVSYRHRA